MKLAEALIERADLKIKIENLKERLQDNSKVQEGATVNENPEELINILNNYMVRLEYLITHINKTNSMSKIDNNTTLADLIAKRDVLTQKHNILDEFVKSGSKVTNRYSNSEIRLLTTFNVPKMQKEVDCLSKQIRETDTKIQELNWITELV